MNETQQLNVIFNCYIYLVVSAIWASKIGIHEQLIVLTKWIDINLIIC